MVQDIQPHQFQNAFQAPVPSLDDPVLAYRDGRLLLDSREGIRLPGCGAVTAEPQRLQYLFSLDDQPYFLLEKEGPDPFEDFGYVDSAAYRSLTPPELRYACAVGESLHRWYGANRFCGGCGAPMGKSGRERALVCPRCGQTVYPKICPAVIVAVCDGERLLLTKYAGRTTRQYALVAGFAEIGESIEDTARREVWEEVGLHITDLRFYKSQPWVFTDTLLMGFFVRLEGSSQVHLQLEELSVGKWFRREALPTDHSGISLTGEMIETFRRGEDPFSREKI